LTQQPATTQDFYGPSILRLDLPRGTAQPAASRWALATIAAVAVSLLACFALASAAILLFPQLSTYEHFQFGDYSKLTVLGVVAACVGWPVVAWFSSNGRRLYLWLGVLATVVSLAPDVWILHQGQPLIGVVTLAVMHVALGVATVAAILLLAPQSGRGKAERRHETGKPPPAPIL
jgi:hypothetical protein